MLLKFNRRDCPLRSTDFATNLKTLTTHTCKLNDVQAKTLLAWLRSQDFVFSEAPYSQYAASKSNTNLVFYESGKLVVQGKGTKEFVEFVLEPIILREARIGYEAVLNPEILLPRVGVDESGKGDFFGPLCIAGVYVNESVIKAWSESGIRDSKKIHSDKSIQKLAEQIRQTPGCITTVVPIGNEAYNRLHRSMKSVNAVLAWGHARVIENLMLQKHRMAPPPVRAISDQFSSDKGTVEQALMGLGREIELVQRHRAEEDIAVAAASILARHEFVQRLEKLGKELGFSLPKGASPAVEAVAKQILEQRGLNSMEKVSKMHFRTAKRVQGLPEPPRVVWGKSKKRG